MSATLKKIEEIKKKKAELQREEEALKTLFMEEFVEIVSTLDPLKVDLEVLIGSMAITIEEASYDPLHSSERTQNSITEWRKRGTLEMARFHRKKRSKSKKDEPKEDLKRDQREAFEKQNSSLSL